jgi:N-acetylglucosaminyldiphosphoundecaprenol N-acetyl-beta-D-mannosaminyltransferase
MKRYSIGKIKINITNIDDTLCQIGNAIQKKQYGYICVTNSRTAYQANHDEEYLKIQNNSLMTVPDGIPLIWIAHNKGFKEVGRVCGPDLFPNILKISKEKNYSHFFFGSTPKTISIIKNKFKNEYPEIEIKGAVSPPFQPIEDYNIEELAKEINRLKPTFFWCGLGAPKQEQLMALLQPKLEATICVGIGLVFEYFANTVDRAPKWAQKIGLEWFFRLAQQPKKITRIGRPYIWTIKQLIISKLS